MCCAWNENMLILLWKGSECSCLYKHSHTHTPRGKLKHVCVSVQYEWCVKIKFQFTIDIRFWRRRNILMHDQIYIPVY